MCPRVQAHCEGAQQAGAELRWGQQVVQWGAAGDHLHRALHEQATLAVSVVDIFFLGRPSLFFAPLAWLLYAPTYSDGRRNLGECAQPKCKDLPEEG